MVGTSTQPTERETLNAHTKSPRRRRKKNSKVDATAIAAIAYPRVLLWGLAPSRISQVTYILAPSRISQIPYILNPSHTTRLPPLQPGSLPYNTAWISPVPVPGPRTQNKRTDGRRGAKGQKNPARSKEKGSQGRICRRHTKMR